MHCPKHHLFTKKVLEIPTNRKRIKFKSTLLQIRLLKIWSLLEMLSNSKNGVKKHALLKTLFFWKKFLESHNLKAPFENKPRSQRCFSFESWTIDLGGASIASGVFFCPLKLFSP